MGGIGPLPRRAVQYRSVPAPLYAPARGSSFDIEIGIVVLELNRKGRSPPT